jgi:alpha-L-fucosidase
VKELLAYEPDIFWFDTPVSMTKERIEPFITELKPFKNLIINDRLGGGGDFASSEQMIPTYPLPRDLEVCMTLGSKWSYAPTSDKHKSPRDVIAKMVETVSKNGNMIYGFGPAPDGTFPDKVTERLKIMGEWLKRNGEVIYGTQGGPFPYLSYGFATRSKGSLLNLIIFDWPKDGYLRVPILSAVKGARLLGSSEKLEISRDDQRVTVKVPATAPDPIASVVILELDGDLVVRSNPTEYASVKASHNEKDAPNMLALDTKRNYWITPKGTTTATLDFSFKKPAVISAVRLEEPDIWPRVEQAYVLEAEINGAWNKVSEGVTGGVGARLDFEPVTTLALKLTLTTKTGVPGMAKVLFISPE